MEFGVVGKTLDLIVGDRIQLTCSRVMTSTGALSGENFRVIGRAINLISKLGVITAVRDVQIHS